MNEANLRELFNRIRDGDQEAFERVYQELEKPIYTICWRIIRSRETAEDITHDVFLRLYSAPPDDSVRNLRAWVFQVARNLSIDALRKNTLTARQNEDPHTADEFSRLHVRMDLEFALGKLPAQEREILTLHLNADLNFREISGIVGLSLPAAYRKYRKAIKMIQTELNGG